MSFWELIFARNQNAGQQNELTGSRINSGRFEGAANSALSAAAQWRQLSEKQERQIGELHREVDRALDENDEVRRTLRALRQQHEQLAAANEKLLRERHVLLDLAGHSASRCEARNRVVRELREKIGEAELNRLLGATPTERVTHFMGELAADDLWQQTRAHYVAEEVDKRLKQLEQTPASSA